MGRLPDVVYVEGPMPDERIDRLKKLLRERAVRYGKPGEFRLASGGTSDVYVDGKQLTLSSEGVGLIAELLWEKMAPYRPDAIGGFVIGADPMVGAVLAHAAKLHIPICGFLVRKEPKDHGTGRCVEGPRPAAERPRVIVVDDVATTGGSAIAAVERVREEWNAEVVAVFAVVDREAGAKEAFAAKGCVFQALVRLSELRPPAQ